MRDHKKKYGSLFLFTFSLLLGEVNEEVQLSENLVSGLAVSDIILDALFAEGNDESFFDLLQLKDIADESKGAFCSCCLVDSKNFAEEAGLLLFLTNLLIVVVDFVLIDSNDSFLLDAHIVDFYNRKFLILRSFTKTNRHVGLNNRLFLLEKRQSPDYFRVVAQLRLRLIDESFGFDLNTIITT